MMNYINKVLNATPTRPTRSTEGLLSGYEWIIYVAAGVLALIIVLVVLFLLMKDKKIEKPLETKEKKKKEPKAKKEKEPKAGKEKKKKGPKKDTASLTRDLWSMDSVDEDAEKESINTDTDEKKNEQI